LLPPNDPQVAIIQAEVEAAKVNGCPSGYNGADECFGLYEHKIPADKNYYDPRFNGWYLFTCTAKEVDRPSVVDMAFTPIIDPGAVYSGMVGYVNAGISYYPKGKAGIGGWLNGVMVTAEEPPMGRLDNKPSVEQMFAGVQGGAQVQAAPQMAAPMAPPVVAGQPPVTNPPHMQAPAPMTPVRAAPAPMTPAPPAPASIALQMTAAANGATYESMIAAGWTDETLLAQGMAIKPSFA
jgi:hypothetical protein